MCTGSAQVPIVGLFVDHVSLPFNLVSIALAFTWIPLARTMDDPTHGGRTREKIRPPMFVPVTDDANSCDKN